MPVLRGAAPGRTRPVRRPLTEAIGYQWRPLLTDAIFNHMVNSRLDRQFAALADPTRRAILDRLAQGEQTVSILAAPFSMSLPAVSKHLTVLEHAGLVTRTRRGRYQYCRLREDGFDGPTQWLQRHTRFWNDRLDALDSHLSRKEPS